MTTITPRQAAPAAVLDSASARKADLATIHIAKARLQWSEDEYRDIMATVCNGHRSSASLDFALRKRFLAHMQDCLRRDGRAPPAKKVPWTPSQSLVWSLWQRLADAHLVDDRARSALYKWIKRQTGVDRLEWLNKHQLDAVILALKGWLARGRDSD